MPIFLKGDSMTYLKSKKAFTLIELLVVIAIIALLLAILMPSLKKAKHKAQELVCRAHLKQFGVAGLTYAHDNDGKWVECHAKANIGIGSFCVYIYSGGNERWYGAGNFFKVGEIENPKIYYCPGNSNKTHQYGKDHPNPSDSGGGWPIGELPDDLHPGQQWVQTTYYYRSLWDGDKWRAVNSSKDDSATAFMADVFADPDRGVDHHHLNRYNVVYIDGHCEAVVDKEREIVNFNGGARYHAGSGGYTLMDRVWKRYFDQGRRYDEKP